jgi:hypothetical protein
VVVGEDVAEAVNEKSGARGDLTLALVEEIEGAVDLLHQLGANEHHPGRQPVIDGKRGLAAGRIGGLLGHQRRLVDDRLGLAATGHARDEERAADDKTPEDRRDEVRLQQPTHADECRATA